MASGRRGRLATMQWQFSLPAQRYSAILRCGRHTGQSPAPGPLSAPGVTRQGCRRMATGLAADLCT
eukprot:11192473-Lingulodinium_polyedra.AAC.1